jgi:hypothetical protein
MNRLFVCLVLLDILHHTCCCCCVAPATGKDVPETKDQTTVLPMTDATPSPSSPSPRRSKRKSRREDEVVIEPDKASSSATESAATGKETSAAAAVVRGQQALIPRDLVLPRVDASSVRGAPS